MASRVAIHSLSISQILPFYPAYAIGILIYSIVKVLIDHRWARYANYANHANYANLIEDSDTLVGNVIFRS